MGCRLALTSLPPEVLDVRWDVVVGGVPSRAGPGEPGRMGAIYTTTALAPAGGEAVDVAVHEMNRTTGRSDATTSLLYRAAPWLSADERLTAAAGQQGKGEHGC